jgi:hypothetical protein
MLGYKMPSIPLKLRLVQVICSVLPADKGAAFALYHQIKYLYPDATNKFTILRWVCVSMAVFRHETNAFKSDFFKRSNNVCAMMEASQREQWGMIDLVGAEGKPTGYVKYSSYFWSTFDWLRYWSVSWGYSNWAEIEAFADATNSAHGDDAWDIYLPNVIEQMKQQNYFGASLSTYMNGAEYWQEQYCNYDQAQVVKLNRVLIVGSVLVAGVVVTAGSYVYQNNKRKQLKR